MAGSKVYFVFRICRCDSKNMITNEKHPAVRPVWSYRRVAVYGSSIHFFAYLSADFLYAILRQFYAIFPWKGIELHGLMCFRNIEKTSVYQALSAFVEIH